MFRNLFEFYRSKEWEDFRKVVIAERVREDGFVYDEYTNKPIVKAYDIILHHKIELTEENVHDYSISLNPENIMIVSHKSHNIIHNKVNNSNSYRKVYLVYGAPFSGLKDFVQDSKENGDLIVDIDYIWRCVSGCDLYVKPKRLNAVVFKVRDQLLDSVKYRVGKWRTAYVCGGYPLTAERERLTKELGAEEVFIESTAEECFERMKALDLTDQEDQIKYINDWFEKYGGNI